MADQTLRRGKNREPSTQFVESPTLRLVLLPAVASTNSYRGLPEQERPRLLGRGMTQLSLVEHALCPLDPDASLRPNLVHEADYFFSNRQGQRLRATARVVCPAGLSAYDEFYLWGLLALTLSQPQPTVEFTATPHYCLRQLGLIGNTLCRGGKTYDLFRSAIERLSAVTYQNDRFYDPVRSEHCEVSFGFLSYRLPLDGGSSRAWRFYWDPLFFEVCQATGSGLSFDLDTYRQLNSASRRLYLLLKKIFWRRDSSLPFDVRHLAVNIMGFSATQDTRRLKAKLTHCIERLVQHGILALPPEASIKSLFRKQRKGQRTAPDWWRELRRQEERQRWRRTRAHAASFSTCSSVTVFEHSPTAGRFKWSSAMTSFGPSTTTTPNSFNFAR